VATGHEINEDDSQANPWNLVLQHEGPKSCILRELERGAILMAQYQPIQIEIGILCLVYLLSLFKNPNE
jgi:hypothetical protein